MVERDLAKVDVAGSIPVFRSYIIKAVLDSVAATQFAEMAQW